MLESEVLRAATRRLDSTDNPFGAGRVGWPSRGSALPVNRTYPSALDCALTVAGCDGDLARLRLLGDRHLKSEHTIVVAGRDLVQIYVVAQDQLPAEDPAGTLVGEELDVAITSWPIGAHSKHIPLNVQIDRVRIDTGQVELNVERVVLAPCIHRHE